MTIWSFLGRRGEEHYGRRSQVALLGLAGGGRGGGGNRHNPTREGRGAAGAGAPAYGRGSLSGPLGRKRRYRLASPGRPVGGGCGLFGRLGFGFALPSRH